MPRTAFMQGQGDAPHIKHGNALHSLHAGAARVEEAAFAVTGQRLCSSRSPSWITSSRGVSSPGGQTGVRCVGLCGGLQRCDLRLVACDVPLHGTRIAGRFIS